MENIEEWQTSPDDKDAGVEGIIIDEGANVAIIKLSLESLECELTYVVTLEPVLSLSGKICDKTALTEWVRKKGRDPWNENLPMTEASIRTSKIHEAAAFAWFKKNPDKFVVGENFLALFMRFVDKNDPELMASLLSAALRCEVNFDAIVLLELAYKSDKVKIFACVLGAFVNAQREISSTPIQNMVFNEIAKGRLEWVQAILGHYRNFSTELNGRLLHSAVTGGQIEIVRYLCALPNIPQLAVDNMTPLYFACRENNIEIVKILLQHSVRHLDAMSGASLDDTPLCVATENANLELVQVLLQAGASLNLPGKKHRTPFLVAVAQAANNLIRYFIEIAELNWLARDVNGNTVLNLACQTQNATGLRLILQGMPDDDREELYNAQIGADSLLGWSIKSALVCANVLIEYGIGLFSLSNGHSPLQLAQAQSRATLVERITQYYSTHPREIFQYLIHMQPGTTPIFKDWLGLKEAIFREILPYVRTLSADNIVDTDELALIINNLEDPESPIQQFFKQKPSGISGWFASNPYPEQLKNLAPHLQGILEPEDDMIGYGN